MYFYAIIVIGAIYEFKFDDANNFQGLFVTTKEMQRAVESWPEIICMDGTYKLIRQGYPLIVFVIIDGNGSTRFAGFSIVCHEDVPTMQWLLSIFQKHNVTACVRIESFMTDNAMLCRDLIHEMFSVVAFICCFHVF